MNILQKSKLTDTKGKLYVISTPIGNLADITYRAIETLKQETYICCEDIREVQALLKNYFDISDKVIFSYHGCGINKALELLNNGQNVCLVSDRGTPCISDPGNELIRACHIGNIMQENNEETIDTKSIEVVSVPGASAVIALISIAGINGKIGGKFMFYGFLPKNGIESELRNLIPILSFCPIVFYESPYRITKTLKYMQSLFTQECEVVVGRELTKRFEQVYIGTLTDDFISQLPDKGEYVFAIYYK